MPELTNSDYISSFRIDAKMMQSVKEHRAINGITPMSIIMVQLWKTRKTCKTIITDYTFRLK